MLNNPKVNSTGNKEFRVTQATESKQFKVDLSSLDTPRLPGISAIMRIKNGEDFLRLSIESHLPYYDEIIACYNDCQDNTVQILNELQQRYPDKIKVFEYLPKVHPIFSVEHNSCKTDDLHSLANYCNFALSKARYSVATKLDDDHLAIEQNLVPLIAEIRNDIAKGHKKIYTFSGVNLAKGENDNIGIYMNDPLVGIGDHMYFPVTSNIYFSQEKDMEAFKFLGKSFEKQYKGIMYFHLKYLKQGGGFHNLAPEKAKLEWTERLEKYSVADIATFLSKDNLSKLKNRHNPVEFWLRNNSLVNKLIYTFFKKNPPLRIARLARIKQDLDSIDLNQYIKIILAFKAH